jgi:hypothetical protein
MSANASKSRVSGIHRIELTSSGQRCIRVDLTQGAFDLATAVENRCDLGCRDAGAARFASLRSLSLNDTGLEES